MHLLFTIIRRIRIFAVPAAILLLTCYLIPHLYKLTPAQQELAGLAPYLVALLGLFISVHFHRGRPFMALLMLIAFYWASRSYLMGQFEPAVNRIYQAYVLLVPFNMVLFAMMRERGIFTTAGRLRLAFLAIQGAGTYWLFNHHFADILPYIARGYLRWSLLDNLLVPQAALLAGIPCFLMIAYLAQRRQAPIDSGLLGALTAFYIACNWMGNRDIHSAYSTAGALIITLSVLRDSYNMAFRDDLTGIPSRRSLNECLHGLGRRYTIAMLDVDHFKRFNDTYGHDVGDQVLKMVAWKMMDVGGGGRAYRYGGEEFAIIFSGRRADEALPHLEELRQTIADYRLTLRSQERPKNQKQGQEQRGSRSGRKDGAFASVTVSIGVAESGDQLKSAAEVIKAADRALYKAKNRGRNQVSR